MRINVTIDSAIFFLRVPEFFLIKRYHIPTVILSEGSQQGLRHSLLITVLSTALSEVCNTHRITADEVALKLDFPQTHACLFVPHVVLLRESTQPKL